MFLLLKPGQLRISSLSSSVDGEHCFLTHGVPLSALGKPDSASLKLLPLEASVTINPNDHTRVEFWLAKKYSGHLWSTL